MLEQSSLTVEHQNDFPRDANEEDQIRTPHIKPISSHIQKIGQTRPVHQVAPCNWPTQAVWRSRSRMIARVRISITAIAYIQHAIDMISMPVSIVLAILGDCVR